MCMVMIKHTDYFTPVVRVELFMTEHKLVEIENGITALVLRIYSEIAPGYNRFYCPPGVMNLSSNDLPNVRRLGISYICP